MSKFDKHFCLDSETVIEYIQEKLPNYFGKDAKLSAKEIGDGNINYVFRVKDENGKTIIVKHADIYYRNTKETVSTDRSRIEYEILQIEKSLAPQYVPELYLYDPIMATVVMQDVGDHENMRYSLIEHRTFPTFADDIATFMANTLIGTTDLVCSPDQKKDWTKQFINKEMCEITERLVLEEPYKNFRNSNKVFEPDKQFLEHELYEDEKLHYEVAILKYLFQTKAQSLIHGDLHSGSVFVKQGSTMVLDPEFAFYGPAGYDVGNIVGHMIFAWVHNEVSEKDENKKETFRKWCEDSIIEIVDGFKQKSLNILKEKCTDVMFNVPGFHEKYVNDILSDSAGYAGTEIIRRIIGSAKFNFITSLEDVDERCALEQISVLIAKTCIKQRDEFTSGQRYIDAIYDVYKKRG